MKSVPAQGTKSEQGHPPKITMLELFRNNHLHGPTDGCITTFTIEEASKNQLTARCGMDKDSVSMVKWKCISSTNGTALFHFEYLPPKGQPDSLKEEKFVEYRGEPIVVFENEISRTTLR